jgi:hypothetical protein
MSTPQFGLGNFTRLRRRALEAVDGYLRKATPDGREILSEFQERLSSRETKSFLLPHNGSVVDRSTPSILTLENCRLPFTSLSLEYSNSARKNSETKWYPDATVLLVFDLRETADESIYAMCLWRAQGQWTPSTFGFVINPKTEIEVQMDGNVMMRNITSYRLKGQVTNHIEHDQIMQDICDEAAVLAHFSLLCNCDNVSPVKVFEPSAALIKSSVERDRIPPDEYWRQRLGESGKRKIFDVAVAAYPNSVGTEDVAAQTGLSARSGTWSTYLGELRTLGLITGRGEIRASEDLF